MEWKMTRIRFRDTDLKRLDSTRTELQKRRKRKVYRATLIRRYVREGLERDRKKGEEEEANTPSPADLKIPLS